MMIKSEFAASLILWTVVHVVVFPEGLPMVAAAGRIDISGDGSIKNHYTQRQWAADALARRRAAELVSSSTDFSPAPSPSPLTSVSHCSDFRFSFFFSFCFVSFLPVFPPFFSSAPLPFLCLKFERFGLDLRTGFRRVPGSTTFRDAFFFIIYFQIFIVKKIFFLF